MARVISELIVSIDGAARGTGSPGYFGFYGPEFGIWLTEKASKPHRNLMGRKTYEMLASVPEEYWDEHHTNLVRSRGWVISSSLEQVEWPCLDVVSSDLCDLVRERKRSIEDEIRIVGSLSVVRQLIAAGLVDCMRLIVCPLVLPRSGVEPAYAGFEDMQFQLLNTNVLDGRILVLDYSPNGCPPKI